MRAQLVQLRGDVVQSRFLVIGRRCHGLQRRLFRSELCYRGRNKRLFFAGRSRCPIIARVVDRVELPARADGRNPIRLLALQCHIFGLAE